mgnify:CR=1 FL=1
MSSKTSKKKVSLVDNTIIFSLISIVLGLLVGAIALLIAGKDPIQAYSAMIEGIFGKPKYIGSNKIDTTYINWFIYCICI